MDRRTGIQCAVAAVWAMASFSALADNYPSKPIRLIVPAAPGGAADFLARIVGPKLSEAMGQSVIIDNRAGASGTIAADLTAKAPGDGYTVLIGQSTSMAVAPHMYEKLPYDTLKDLKPVTLVAELPNIIVINPKLAARDIRELVALAKASGTGLNYGSAGRGAPSHLAGELFEQATGAKFVHVPYKGAGPAANALISGEIDMMFAPLVAVLPQIKAGRMRAIAVTSAVRSPTMPDLPTVAESGFQGYAINSWFGLFVPASTPDAIVDTLYKETAKLLKQPAIIERLAKEGAEPSGSSPADFSKFVRVEYERFGKLVKERDIKSE